MLAVLASGTLNSDPIARKGRSGKPFVTAALRTPSDEGALIIQFIAFDDAVVAALQKLQRGDAVSITGRATLKTWQAREGQRTGLSVVADAILTAYQSRKKRSVTSSKRVAEQDAGTGAPRPDEAGYDDWVQP